MSKPANPVKHMRSPPELVEILLRGTEPFDYIAHNNDPTPDELNRARDILERLLSNSELMQRVWRELFKKSTKTGKYLYPPVIEVGWWNKSNPYNKYPEQERAAAQFLEECYREAVSPRARTLIELQQDKEFFEASVASLRQQRDKMNKLGFRMEALHDHDVFDHYEKLVEVYELELRDLKGKLTGAAQRRTGAVEISDKINRINQLTQKYFGKTLHNTIANLVNIILERNDVTGERVRSVLNNSVAKRKKTAP